MARSTARTARVSLGVAVVAAALVLAACQGGPGSEPSEDEPGAAAADGGDGSPTGTITLAFAGDVHFEGGVASLLSDRDATLGRMSRALARADVSMVNLESALVGLTTPRRPADKELEDLFNRYWFGTTPNALKLLDRSGVDVVSVANNHGADFGRAGLRDTLRAKRDGPVGIVGVGRDPRQAFTPFRTTVGDTDIAVLAADDSPLESNDPTWQVRPGGGPGLAAARDDRRLLAAVREAASTDDVVVVYMHWGEERVACPTRGQRDLARDLAVAGADVVVGSHAHVQLGAGMLRDTYVGYGLGNFLWYHGNQPDTGVLTVRLEDGEVVGDDWAPGVIPPEGGQPVPVSGSGRAVAERQFRSLRGCTGLEPPPGLPGTLEERDGAGSDGGSDGELPAFDSSIGRLTPDLRRRMLGRSHDPASCPLGFDDLRLLTVRHVGFDGEARTGRMVVASRYATDLAGVFEKLYDARFPIRRMQLVDVYAGDDDRSMAADNSSAYNCRRVAGQSYLSDHAYGAAVDINPVENPYLRGDDVDPPAGRRFARLDRTGRAQEPPGVIVQGDVVTRAFADIGWEWGGLWTDPDYQHFSAP